MKTCLNCHFLCAEGLRPGNIRFSESLTSQKRTFESINNFELVGNIPWYVKCYHGYWNSESMKNKSDAINAIVKTNRNRCVFFTKYVNSADLHTVEIEKKTKSEISDKIFNRVISLSALIISVISIFISIVTTLK
jgi:hypothetical protein